ncbi:hypothetical protein PIB30_063762 [Stylosanthes scabra]|uniref:Uncharacterized protein n=1 Tax=Stylosanthes scabra TaxID=79078 RepID=A0ABU6TLB6_9FABA|nr:hypothetical protein [Stylosanthes scabra]
MEVDTMDAILAQNKAISQQLNALNKKVEKLEVALMNPYFMIKYVGVASRLHKHQQNLPTQQESCPLALKQRKQLTSNNRTCPRNKWSCARSFLVPATLLAQEMIVDTHLRAEFHSNRRVEVEFQVFGPRPRPSPNSFYLKEEWLKHKGG